MKLNEQLRVLRDKEQKITVKDGDTIIVDRGTKNDVTYGVLNRDVFSTIVEDDKSVTISLVNRDAVKRK